MKPGSKYVILGGGMVAGYAAKELVNRGLAPGELTIISADDMLPYERPPLSKGFLAGKETDSGILINSPEWYREHGITVILETVVDSVDLPQRHLRAPSSQRFEFDTLLIATGARARRLDCPGNDLPNVFYLRSVDDSRRIRAQTGEAKQAVVIGGGFIGMEAASVLAQKNIETTLIIREERVWSRVLTRAMSEFFDRYYAARGVRLVKNASVTAITGNRPLELSLSTGRKLSCDMAVAGVGATPATELFEKTGLTLGNGLVVNEYLETSYPRVFAAGDVANYPDSIFDKRRRVEHWDNAVSQGQHWAAVVTGNRRPFVHLPYFFSDVFDLSYELWGDPDGANRTITRGDLSSSSFSVWWMKDQRLVCAFTMNRPDEERQLAQDWITSKQSVSSERLADGKRPIADAIQKVG